VQTNDEYWMKAALRQAAKARLADEPPIGAVVVLDSRIVGRGYNLRETRQDVTLHAELAAIRQASRKLGSWRLAGCTLYVTLEPCLMCAGAIIQARFDRVVYGATDPKAGACGSVVDAFAIRFNHQVSVQGGVLADACSAPLKSFFQERRVLDKAAGSRAVRRNQAMRSIPRGAGSPPAPGGEEKPAHG
jgi:tRNA(adenine34) deaminase